MLFSKKIYHTPNTKAEYFHPARPEMAKTKPKSQREALRWDTYSPVFISFEIGWEPDDAWIPDSSYRGYNDPDVALNLDRLVAEAGLGADVLLKLKPLAKGAYYEAFSRRELRDILKVGEIGYYVSAGDDFFEVEGEGLADCASSGDVAYMLRRLLRNCCPGLSEDEISLLTDDAITSDIAEDLRFAIEDIIANVDYSNEVKWAASHWDD